MMQGNTIQILITMILYMLVVIGIGLFFAKRANQDSENYFIGGRSLGPWVAAMSAEASDMSGWLLMGLPGVAYWCGLDRHRLGHRHLYQLAAGCKALAPLFCRGRQRHHHSGLFQQPFS